MSASSEKLSAALRHPLGGSALFLALFYLAMRYLLGYVGAWLAADDWFGLREGLPSSGKEGPLYMTLAVVATYCWLTYSEARWQQFWQPVFGFLRWRSPARTFALVLFPLFVGGLVFLRQAGGAPEPVTNPIRHPTPPDEFSKLVNPFRDPTEEMLAAFDKKLEAGEIDLDTCTEPQVIAYAKSRKEGNATDEARAAAFRRRAIEEGRNLFMINCRPCHGTKAMGDGPMSLGQRREPADFSGVETIATLVEGAVFWRVNKGGIKLPREGAPWESAMPRWEEDLTEEEIWKIIMAEYDLAGNAPRVPEGHGGGK